MVEIMPDGTITLRSNDFEGLTEPCEVYERGRILISRLNGAILLFYGDTRPLEIGHVLWIDERGVVQRRYSISSGTSRSISRVRGYSALVGPDGEEIKQSPQQSVPQHWNNLATKNQIVSELLLHFGKADNWYDIYKTIEFSENLAGNKNKLHSLMAGRTQDVKNLRREANFYRHAKANRPDVRPTLEEAKLLLADIVRKVLSQDPAPPGPNYICSILPPHVTQLQRNGT